jgi:hypothetical protein
MIRILLFLAITLSATANYATTPEEIANWAKTYKYDRPSLLVAIAKKESGLNPLQFNEEKSGSYGLMQIQCDTARQMGLKYSCDQLFDPHINVRFGIKWLRFIEDRLADTRPRNIIAAYNAGFEHKERAKLVSNCKVVVKRVANELRSTDPAECNKIKWHARRCKNYNKFNYPGFPPMECYPGEYINEEYVWKVYRLYNYLKGRE